MFFLPLLTLIITSVTALILTATFFNAYRPYLYIESGKGQKFIISNIGKVPALNTKLSFNIHNNKKSTEEVTTSTLAIGPQQKYQTTIPASHKNPNKDEPLEIIINYESPPLTFGFFKRSFKTKLIVSGLGENEWNIETSKMI